MAELLPAVFFGHGNPMNALLDDGYSGAPRAVGTSRRALRPIREEET
jgi:hypothetical protein